MLKRFVATVAYTVDITLPTDEHGKADQSVLQQNLEAFGAREVKVTLAPYTGAGQHEFVGSSDPGLQHLALCIKCRKTKEEAGETCPGIKVK